jgi:hypothetical protein
MTIDFQCIKLLKSAGGKNKAIADQKPPAFQFENFFRLVQAAVARLSVYHILYTDHYINVPTTYMTIAHAINEPDIDINKSVITFFKGCSTTFTDIST